jgi:trimeric autotransporter adhesin
MNPNSRRNACRILTVVCLVFAGLAAFPPSALRAQGIITTIAGGVSPSGRATSAEIVYPSSVARDKAGNLYVAAIEQSEVLKIAPSGKITVVAGTGYGSFSGDGGPAISAALDLAGIYVLDVFGGLALDASGNLFITDSLGQRVRRVDASTGIITTVAGNGTSGYSGDGGPATEATLSYPSGVGVDGSGNLFIADGNNVIRRVDAVTGIITTYAGNGTYGYSGDGGPATSAELGYPTSVVLDRAGNLFMADQSNNVIRRVDVKTNVITTVAGDYALGAGYSGDGGPARSAAMNLPGGITLDARGDLYITDSGNNAVRRVDAKTQIITTVAGNGTGLPGYSGDGGPATNATLNLVEDYYGAAGGIVVDPAGDLFIPDISNNRLRRVDGVSGVITTFAGGGTGGDGRAAVLSTLAFPGQLAIDGAGNIFIDDFNEARIRRIAAATGRVSTVAGDGLNLPYPGDGGQATSASFLFSTFGVAADRAGDFFISDSWEARVLRVHATLGVITTVAGTGVAGYSGDGGPATSAEVNFTHGVAVDASGDLFIADSDNERIRRVDATTGIITTVAGNGTAGFSGDGGLATNAELSYPRCVTLDRQGDLYICDRNNYRLRRVDAKTGIITTVAGNGTSGFSGDGGPATDAEISTLSQAAVDASGNVFFTDTDNQRVRRLDAFNGFIDTVAGSGPAGNTISTFSGDGGPAIDAVLNFPYGIALDKSGDLLIGDSVNNRVREVTAFPFASLPGTSLTFGDQTVGTVSPPQTVTMKNTGAVALSITNVAVGGYFLETNNCGTSLAAGATCAFKVSFAPKAAGAQSGTVTITDDAPNSPQTISLSGTGVTQ